MDVKEEIRRVEREIEGVQLEIDNAASEVQNLTGTNDIASLQYWRTKEGQLRSKEGQLRTEKLQLRSKEGQPYQTVAAEEGCHIVLSSPCFHHGFYFH